MGGRGAGVVVTCRSFRSGLHAASSQGSGQDEDIPPTASGQDAHTASGQDVSLNV